MPIASLALHAARTIGNVQTAMEDATLNRADISLAIGRKLVWSYQRILRPHLILSVDQGGPVVMDFRRRTPFSLRQTFVRWPGFSGVIEMQLTGPNWTSFVPFWGRRVQDYYTLHSEAGDQLAVSTGIVNNPVSIQIGSRTFFYHRQQHRWRRYLTLADEQGEIISGPDGRPEMELQRTVEGLEIVLAMYWLIRLCDWDGHEH